MRRRRLEIFVRPSRVADPRLALRCLGGLCPFSERGSGLERRRYLGPGWYTDSSHLVGYFVLR